MIKLKSLRRNSINRRVIAATVLFLFCFSTVVTPITPLYAQDVPGLPAPGKMVGLSPEFSPPILKGIKVYPENPFRFDFLLDKGLSSELANEAARIKDESARLIKYFLVSLTVPEKDLWVNLSPYEKDRIIANEFGLTEMGRDLLAQDYILKQLTASIMYPEDAVGKRFWQQVYHKAYELYGTTDIPVDTFNKVWIVPEKAVVYENAQAGTAYVVESRLKVMLESDYLAIEKNAGRDVVTDQVSSQNSETQELAKAVIREIVIPELEREVNEGRNFAQVRQVYNSIILASWFKKKVTESLLEKVYVDQKKIAGVDVDNPEIAKEIWEQYVQAFRKGAYNFIKEEFDPLTEETIPRKYFSGGAEFTDFAMRTALEVRALDPATAAKDLQAVNTGTLVTVSSLFTPMGVPATALPLSIDVSLEKPAVALSHLPSKTRLGRILRVLAESEGDHPGAYATTPQILERLITRLKERGLVRETIDVEGNAVIEIAPVEGDRLYQALDRWVFNPSDGPGVKAVNFQSSLEGEFKGKWIIIGLATGLADRAVLEHEQLEAKFRRENPDKSWVWAHNKVVSETGAGTLLDEGLALKENRQDADLGTNFISDWLRKSQDRVVDKVEADELESQGARIIETDMTLDYGGIMKWNLERIFIDLVQNHKPADAKGTRVTLQIHLKDGRTLDIISPELSAVPHDQVESIEISDDGIGYDYEHLKYFLTTKGSMEEGGKFGEGLKIATAAAISQNMSLEFRSRAWIGRPLLREKILNAGHPNEIKTKNVILGIWDNGEIKGSRTFIHNPSQEFFAVVKRGAGLVLDLRKKYQPEARLENIGEIVGESSGKTSVIYVKRNKIFSLPHNSFGPYTALFDYNLFKDDALNRDRDTLPKNVVEDVVFRLILSSATPEMIKKMLQKAYYVPESKDIPIPEQFFENDEYLSSYKLQYMSQADKDRWVSVFHQLYGRDAIIGLTEKGYPDESTKKAVAAKYNVVFISGNMKSILMYCGIKDTKSLYFQKELKIDTGIALDYRQGAWSFERILLDGVQNHLKTDSGATEIHAEFQVVGEDGWRDLGEIEKFTNEQIASVRIRDNGLGYDYPLLGLLHSTKDQGTTAAGGWGEGLKMLSAAVLREGMGIRLKSREWEATAGTETKFYTSTEGRNIDVKVLNYDIKRYHHSEAGAMTTFFNLKPGLIDLFRALSSKVLSLNPDYVPVSRSVNGEIVTLGKPGLYVQGLEFKDVLHGNHNVLMTYNIIGIADIVTSPDRNVLHPGKVDEAIGNILATTGSAEALQRVLEAAIDNPRAVRPEFQNYSKKPGMTNWDTWKKAWLKLVQDRGWNPDRLVLGSLRTFLDPDAQILFRNMGYQVVFIESNFEDLVHSFGVPLDKDLLASEFEYTTSFTPAEQEVLAFRKNLDAMLINVLRAQDASINIDDVERKRHAEWADRIENAPREIEVFSAVKSKVTGVKIAGWLGYFNRTTEKIGVLQDSLASKWAFAMTYIHETLHWLSGENDDTRAFETAIFSVLTKAILELNKKDTDEAMMSAPGGIDLNISKMDFQVQNSGEAIRFNIDPALIRQMQDATGLVPLIIDFQPTQSLTQFMGIK